MLLKDLTISSQIENRDYLDLIRIYIGMLIIVDIRDGHWYSSRFKVHLISM